jgi:hypothetical protein
VIAQGCKHQRERHTDIIIERPSLRADAVAAEP